MPPICAVVVTCHPDDAVVGNIEALRPQVAQVMVIDNGSGDEVRRQLSLLSGPGVEVIFNPENRGIATALNQGVSWARARGFSWVATFDQDSRVPPGYFATLLTAYEGFVPRDRVAVLAPRVRDRRTGRTYSLVHGAGRGPAPVALVPFAITSGSLIAMAAFDRVGLYREDLFIDGVDVEFCLRCRRGGWYVLEAQDAVLDHQLGSPTQHRLLWMRPSVTNHSVERKYYAMRNRMVLYRCYGTFDPAWLLRDAREALRNLAKLVLFEDDRLAKLRATVRGLWHGLTGRLGPWRR